MDNWWDSLRIAFLGMLGTANLAAMSPGKRSFFHALRVIGAVSRELGGGQLSMRAMGLVYTTLLSLVPLLAVSFSVLKAFGVHNQLEGTLLGLMAPLGEQGIRITDQIVGFVENMKVGALGSLGLALLIWTVISLMQKIESAVNHTWRIRRTRGIVDRFSRYLSVVLVGPVLVFSAMGISASLMSSAAAQQIMAVQPLGEAVRFFTGLLPYVLLTAAFTFVYMYIPNTRVRFAAAMAGGFIAALLWAGAGWAFAAFIVSSTSKWTAVYSSLAILMLFMVWLYVGWTILLVGAAVSFYVQNPQYVVVGAGEPYPGYRRAEQIGLAAVCLIARRFIAGGDAYSASELAAELQSPLKPLRESLRRLQRHGLLTQQASEVERFLPARDLAAISVLEVWRALRADDEPDTHGPGMPVQVGGSEHLIGSMDEAMKSIAGELSVRELAEQSSAAAPPGRQSEAGQPEAGQAQAEQTGAEVESISTARTVSGGGS